GETRNWTVVQRNEQLFPLSGLFLLNRLIWLLISLLLLLISYKSFQYRLVPGKKKKKKQADEIIVNNEFQPVPVHWPAKRYGLRVFSAQLKMETFSLFRHLPFLFLLILWIFLFIIDLKEEALEGPYGIRYYAITGVIVEKLRSMNPALFLLVLYASEILHREYTSKMQGLVFSAPACTGVLWAAKLATLLLLIFILVTVNIAIGTGTQLLAGHVQVEFSKYGWLYYYSAFPLFLYAVLIFFVQSLLRNKFLGLMLSLVICGVFVFGKMLGLRSLLLRYATLPDLRYSDLNGFGHYADPVHWYLFYWTCLAFMLAWVAALLWRRFAVAQKPRLSKNGLVMLCIALAGWSGSGAFIYSAGKKDMSRNSAEWQKDYELKYGSSRLMEQPLILAVYTKVDIYTAEARYTVKGKYLVKNESVQAIDTLWLGLSPEVDKVQFSIPDAMAIYADAGFNQYRYLLKKPLLPGDSMELEFSTDVHRGRFCRFNSEHSVVQNGTYIELEKYIPWFGYQPGQEVDDPAKRAVLKLPPQTPVIVSDSLYHFIRFETVVSTDAGQQAITVGALQKEWRSGNRQFFHYKTDHPIPFMLAISSGKYAVAKAEMDGISFSIYHHREHEENIPVMMQGMKDAVAYGNAHFCRYPFSELRLAEVPHYPGAATAYPGTVFSAERINFLSDHRNSNQLNAVYTVAAHETAHQWWADILSPQVVPGRAMLTESLAKYTELAVAERRFGSEKLRDQLIREHEIYFNLRNSYSEKELPLQRSDQSWVYYQKGALALYAIQQKIGEARMHRALQQLLAKHGTGKKRPIPADLLRELMAVSNEAEQQFITEQLQKVIICEAGMKLVSCTQQPDGSWAIKIALNLSKWDHTNGTPVKLPSNADVHLGFYPSGNNQKMQLQRIAVSHEQQTLSLVPGFKPSMIILDPFMQLMDADRTDNVLKIP
ncbi:MAG: M1 family aminopeptidase, partial [Pseudobacter sp.]|uniref:M1 family aminopeptidase n=1 Tax=Pseudobacter sp. TaxID=2045420 RepID=UPI003F7E0302